MNPLVRIALQAELAENCKIVKEAHGRKILLARTGGQLFATDAHCFHMGGNLWEGDIEDVGGHPCVVCPLHRYRIDMRSGKKVDTMLDGCVSCGSDQQQRTYAVHADDEFIFVHIPELHSQPQLPSDRYNQAAPAPAPGATQQPGATPARSNYGLFGSSSRAGGATAGAPELLAPYAGISQRGLVPATPARDAMEDEPALQLSQEAGIQLSQPSPAAQRQQQQLMQQQQQPVHHTQGHIPFAQSRADTAHIARRKAATAAIAARRYTPPTAQPPRPPARGLLSSGAAPSPQLQPQPAAAGGGQQSLLSFGFTVQQHGTPVAASGPESMDVE